MQDTLRTTPSSVLQTPWTLCCPENATAGDLCGPVTVTFVNDTAFTDALGNYTVTRTFTN